MSRLIIFIFFCFLCISASPAKGQGISNNNIVFQGNTSICKGDLVTLTITEAYLVGNSPINSAPIMVQDRSYSAGASMCNYSPGKFFDITQTLPFASGNNVLSIVPTFTGTICNPVYKVTLTAKPSASTTYFVHWQSRYTYNNYLNYPVGSYTDYIYNGSINVTVTEVNKPTVTANKALILPTEHATLTATGGNAGATYQWRNGCAGSLWNIGGNPIQVGTGTYYARCVLNGCIGDSSEPIVILPETSSPVALGCNNSEAQNIYAFTRVGNDGRADYHQYNVETNICESGAGNPNCTLQNIWLKLKSNPFNDLPIATDLTPAAGSKMQTVFSNVLFKSPEKIVSNCGVVNLPGPLGIYVGLVGLGTLNNYRIEFDNYINGLTGITPIANPIAQTVDEATHSITNYTLPGHTFYPGRIIRTVVSECGVIKIKTIGVGRSWLGDNVSGKTMSALNAYFGKILFDNIDQRVKNSY